MKPNYCYLYHCSEYREANAKWACIHRDDLNYYWNGDTTTEAGAIPRIGYGSTPELAYENLVNQENG